MTCQVNKQTLLGGCSYLARDRGKKWLSSIAQGESKTKRNTHFGRLAWIGLTTSSSLWPLSLEQYAMCNITVTRKENHHDCILNFIVYVLLLVFDTFLLSPELVGAFSFLLMPSCTFSWQMCRWKSWDLALWPP